MKAKLVEEAIRMEPDPPRSKLDDYAEAIWELRRKRKRIHSITQFLKQHGVSVGKSTVARWLKTHPVPQLAHGTPNQKPQNAPSPESIAKANAFFTSQPKNHESKPYNLDH